MIAGARRCLTGRRCRAQQRDAGALVAQRVCRRIALGMVDDQREPLRWLVEVIADQLHGHFHVVDSRGKGSSTAHRLVVDGGSGARRVPAGTSVIVEKLTLPGAVAGARVMAKVTDRGVPTRPWVTVGETSSATE